MSAGEPVSHVGWLAEVAKLDGMARQLAEVALEGSEMRWTIDREYITKGATFSHVAMDAIKVQLMSFVEARIMARWDQTGEPPSHMEISLEVTVA